MSSSGIAINNFFNWVVAISASNSRSGSIDISVISRELSHGWDNQHRLQWYQPIEEKGQIVGHQLVLEATSNKLFRVILANQQYSLINRKMHGYLIIPTNLANHLANSIEFVPFLLTCKLMLMDQKTWTFWDGKILQMIKPATCQLRQDGQKRDIGAIHIDIHI